MDFIKFFRAAMSRGLLGLLVILSLFIQPAHSLDSLDSQIFIAGFNAYQKKDYAAAIEKMNQVLKQFPDTPLRDMAIFWLARANFRAGNQKEAARFMAQFVREYPESPLKGTVEEELLRNAARYERGEPIAEGVAERGAADKVAAEKAAAEKAESERVAGKAAAEKLAAEQAVKRAVAERLAAEKAAAEKLAAEKLAMENAAAEKAAAEQASARKAEAERLAAQKEAAEKAAAERVAAEKAQAERVAAMKAAAEKAAAAKAERLAAERAEAEKVALTAPQPRPKAPAAVSIKPVVPEKKQVQPAKKGEPLETATRTATLRDKAVAEYKAVIDRFPGTSAAAAAVAKLKALGIAHPSAVATGPAAPAAGENAQVLSFEVGQFAAVEFNVMPGGQSHEVGRPVSIPFEIVNRGNGTDSFYLESGFPADFRQQFAAAAAPDTPINSTPQIPAGERFKGVVTLTPPRQQIDGQKSSYPVKIGSRFAGEVSQSRQISLVASAPLMRAVIKSDKGQVLPGERVSYRVALLNIGTATARSVTFRLNYPPQYEPVDHVAAGFKQEMKAALVLDGVQLKSGESREFTVTFQLKEEAIARQELFVRADVVNNELETRDSFLSTAALVQGVSGVSVRTSVDRLVVIPGQTVTIPLIVTNTGNQGEAVELRPAIPAPLSATFHHDLNRDGIRQPNEPAVARIESLLPKEEAYLLMTVATQASAADGSDAMLKVVLEPESDRQKGAAVAARLVFSRPIVEMALAGKGGRLKPGEVSSFDLNCVNRGSNMARVVELQSVLPADLEMVAADPPFSQMKEGAYAWRFAELGAGEKRSVKVTFRVRGGLEVGTNIQVKTVISYEDQLGNRY